MSTSAELSEPTTGPVAAAAEEDRTSPHTQQRGLAVAPSHGRVRPVPATDVTLRDGFWARRQQLVAGTVLPHAVAWTERLGWLEAFDRTASGRSSRDRRGKLFTDADVYKLVEAHVWQADRDPAGPVANTAADLADLIRSAQEPDGYLNTWYAGEYASERYTDLAFGFELYSYGHLIQAAVAAMRSGGPEDLIEVGLAVAEHLHRWAGDQPRTGIDGHPGLEMALIELARATGDARHRELAARMIASRGHRTLPQHAIGPEYFLDDQPGDEAAVLRGHAVRALYLFMAEVDLAVDTGDHETLDRLVAQWDRTIATRTHLHGGMGSRHLGESFGDDYELPPDRAYAETCTAVAGVMAAWRLTLATGEPRFADHAERALFNMVATSVAPDGQRFLYVNPLQSRGALPTPDPNEAPFRKDTPRASWFWVSCCPTNVARLLTTLNGYVASTDDTGLQLHQYTPCTIEADLGGERGRLSVRTEYPYGSRIEVEIETTGAHPWTLALRVPHWAESATVEVDGVHQPAPVGTVELTRTWSAGDVVVLDLDLVPRITVPDRRIDALRSTVAIERGPLVYCTERPGGDPDTETQLRLGSPPADVVCDVPGADHEAVAIQVDVISSAPAPRPAWPFGGPSDETDRADGSEQLTLVPLHLWGLRGPGPMRVFLPISGEVRNA